MNVNLVTLNIARLELVHQTIFFNQESVIDLDYLHWNHTWNVYGICSIIFLKPRMNQIKMSSYFTIIFNH